MVRCEILVGDVLEQLATLPDESVHCVVTSPPYWGLRDYGTGTWEGGDEGCEHETVAARNGRGGSGAPGKQTQGAFPATFAADTCGKCGATRVDRQLGLEAELWEWVRNLVHVFREVRRVLRSDGTLWLNLGTSYASGGTSANPSRRAQYGPECGTDGTEQSGSRGVDPSYCCSSGELPSETLTRRGHTPCSNPPVGQGAPPHEQTGRDTAPVGSAQATACSLPAGAPASTIPSSTGCVQVASFLAGRPLGDPFEHDQFSPESPGFAHTVERTSGTPSLSQTSDLRNSDMGPSSTAYDTSQDSDALTSLYCTIKSLRLKAKDRIMQPHLVALALQCDGWYLRSDVIWHKPNPMPSSVTDRPTDAHEHIFLLTKSARYFYDAEAVREPNTPDMQRRAAAGHTRGNGTRDASRNDADSLTGGVCEANGRNLRDVWTLATQPYPEAHFATFPEALPERCILAGTSQEGVCPACGAQWARVVERERQPPGDRQNNLDWNKDASRNESGDNVTLRTSITSTTLGFRPTCDCGAEPVPATVLDPFAGSGTTLAVAKRLHRNSIGIELNPEYAALARRRLEVEHDTLF